MMHGLTGTGKSTLSKHLENNIKDLRVFHSAEIRNELKLAPKQIGGTDAGYNFNLNDKVFVEEVSPRVYAEMLNRGDEVLNQGMSVVLDGSYSMRWQRKAVYDYALNHDFPFLVLQCVCSDEDEVKKRIISRSEEKHNPLNEADQWETYVSLRDNSDPLVDDYLQSNLKPPIVRFDTHSGEVSTSGISEDDSNVNLAQNLVEIIIQDYEQA